jgi:1,6-anhydro-N-acetylmuramate kinase
MSPKAKEVMEQAHQLSEDEPRELAIALLDSAVAREIHAAWVEEVRKRVAEVHSGAVATLSNDEALLLVASDD